MRPDNLRQKITIFCRWQNSISGLVKPFRRVLTNCFVAEQGNTIAERTGILLNQALFVQIFNQPDLKYIPLHEWLTLDEDSLNGKWTLDIIAPQSIIVPYEVEHEFNWASMAQITTLENAFIGANPGARRVVSFEDNRRGTPRAQHLYVRA